MASPKSNKWKNETSQNIVKREDYLSILYSEKRRPKGNYPEKLAKHILEVAFNGEKGSLLEIGCGRGDMLNAFHKVGYNVTGIDISPAVSKYCAPHRVAIVDLEHESSPFEEGSFDFVFSKSVIEHLQNPLPLLETAYKMLKPGGIVVIMTPSWVHNSWGPFYLDYTHVTPFTAPSLKDAMLFGNFKEVDVTHFRQLPFLWKYPLLSPFISLFSYLPLPYRPMSEGLITVNWPDGVNKFIRFSKEVMLFAVGKKNTSI